MPKRFAAIWFRYLLTDQLAIRRPSLREKPVAIVTLDHGRKVIVALNAKAIRSGLQTGMTVADAQVLLGDLQIFDDKPGRNLKLLKGLAEWCLRYTPLVAIDPPDGLLLDVTGCTHLKGGEKAYLTEIYQRLKDIGYDVRPAIADTIGAAWGVSRCASNGLLVTAGQHRNALMPLPPSALRLPTPLLLKLHELGLYQISSFIHMPKSVLRRRFGKDLVLRLYQALGQEAEFLFPLKEPVPYTERLDCLEPVKTRPAIEIALQDLLERLCKRLHSEGLGMRKATLTWYRVDGKSGHITIGTNHATHRSPHLFKLFFIHLDEVAPGLGIELFTLDADATEPLSNKQSDLWAGKPWADSEQVAELLDRIASRGEIRHYLPDEHYWPERSSKTDSISAQPQNDWREDKPRPIQLLEPPEPVEAMALTPDYPPKQFIHRGTRHVIVGADGPERIENEWWIDTNTQRDYFIVEDEQGRRYWIFRTTDRWFLHGYFA
ncbi:DNA polymerase Y family protein [Mucilaginibacter limnophilus]|uniref:DNA polymerase Y family protein n=1 Tax=Mucilaginibacter limnophilus TaxID=1932778 RepID=A0A3S2UJJ7_9SPHI|nr:DNA polymerase Y family protein [Mucilaginibacter limnophilus]RVT97326.1 DNA polymerase Y family protein [Mucilaginibacter limnophilus]